MIKYILMSDALADMQAGDFLTGLFRPFTQIFAANFDIGGGMFYAIMFGIMFGAIMMKTQNAAMPLVVFIIVSPVVLFILPPVAISVFTLFAILAGVGTFYKVWSHRGG